ncbi:uncharacterized protein LOC124316133 isoform X1 [Daphnia pulicaria]|uniref:uncharacterized protein LOC124316133 isoform X1 n=1 Tax=Daphnia pulicaria TaxID=35523 RepID=UPI001EEC050E|nr:uncharacterized protein LOC124316133 isoform X1 [Daphnia pulicaria]
MTTIPMNILAIILAFLAVCCNCQSDNNPGASLAKLQISPEPLSSMEYGNFLVEIYEHANNQKSTDSQKKYFYSPLALLDHSSAISTYNKFTKQPEMRFRIEMWNDKVQNEVVKHLNEIVGHQIKSNQVRVIPLEKVILASEIPTADYFLSSLWKKFERSKTLWFSFSCYDQKICDELADQMRSDPKHLDHFKLLYSLSSQTSQTKQTTISIDSVTSGQMVSTLLQKFEDKKEIFLTANDEKKMLAETATNIRMDTFDDYEVGSPNTESQISNILKDLLVTSRTTIKEQSVKMWDSVFWNDDNYRPDKTTKTLNEILNKLDREIQKKLADMFQKAEKQAEIEEKLTSSNKDAEKRRAEQILRENESKDANENENRRSQATDQEQFSRNQTRDDKSTTSRDDTDITVDGVGSDDGVNIATNNSHMHNTDQQNERKESAKKNSDEYDRKMDNKERIQHNYDSNSWANADRISSVISGKLSNDSDSSRRVEIVKEDVEKLLQESRNHVQWDGEKFIPKPIQLSRINLGKFRDSQSFKDRNVRVRYTTAELSAPIKFVEHAELTVTDEWNNLKEELKATTELLTTTVNNLVKTNNELRNAKSDLSNELEGTKKELEKTKANVNNLSAQLNETKKELVTTRADLTKNFDGLSFKLKATEKELAETKITAGNISTELKMNSNQLRQDLKVTEEKLTRDLRATSNDLETAKTNLASTRTELNSTKFAVADLATELKANSQRFSYELKTAEEIMRKLLAATSNDLETAKTNLASTRTELSSTKSAVADLTTKLKANSQRLDNELKATEENLRKELGATLNLLETTTNHLASTTSSTNAIIANLTTKLYAPTSELVDIGRMPTSCADMERMGQRINGFFLVKGSKKMEMVYCNFFSNQNDKQKWIGYADVKSAPVHFYVQRNSDFNTTNTPIPFDLALVNEGDAMDLTSGKFTAPRPGIYFFSFAGVGHLNDSPPAWFYSFLYLNGNRIGMSFVKEENGTVDQYSPFTQQSTLNLKKGDRVWVEISYSGSDSYLYDLSMNHHLTHFTGFMLEEEIVASL